MTGTSQKEISANEENIIVKIKIKQKIRNDFPSRLTVRFFVRWADNANEKFFFNETGK